MNFNEQYFLCHHGIIGMKWGVRRYQNPDGSLTAAGRVRYAKEAHTTANKIYSNKNLDYKQKDELYKNYLRKAKITSEIGKSKDVQEHAKRMADHYAKGKASIQVTTEDLLKAREKAFGEAQRKLEAKYKIKLDPSKKDDYKAIAQEAYDSGLVDKYEASITPASEKKWNKEFDKIYDDYRKVLASEIDKQIGNRGKSLIYGSASTPDSLANVLSDSLFDIYQENIETKGSIVDKKQSAQPKAAKKEKHGSFYSKTEQKQIKNEYKENVRSEEKKLSAKYEAKEKELREEIDRLAKKYDFDLDDGGGGKTKEDEKAGAKYMQLWGEIDDLDRQRRNEAIDISLKKIEDKYDKGGTAYAKKAWMV